MLRNSRTLPYSGFCMPMYVPVVVRTVSCAREGGPSSATTPPSTSARKGSIDNLMVASDAFNSTFMRLPILYLGVRDSAYSYRPAFFLKVDYLGLFVVSYSSVMTWHHVTLSKNIKSLPYTLIWPGNI